MNTVSSKKVQALSLADEVLANDADGRPVLIGGCCNACGAALFPFAAVCPHCMSEDMRREPMPRQGKLYSFTRVHVGPKTWEKPFAVGYVDLENGVRVFSHLRGEAFEIDAPVELAVANIGMSAEGVPISTFVFQPARS